MNNKQREELNNKLELVNSIELPDITPYIEENEYNDVPTYRSISEATAQNGYIDISKEIGSNYVTPTPNELFYDLSKEEESAKQISQMVEKTEEMKKAEKKAEWEKLLSSMTTREDEIAVCSLLSGDVVFEVIEDAIVKIDGVYAKFTKTPSRAERHRELIQEVLNNLKEEENVIEEYKEELKKLD